jgi:NAD-dependent dihydropyrimidine dehydrogenase PreA subunit
MLIDNSAAVQFKFCPWAYYESYVKKIEPKPRMNNEYTPLEFGARMHELLEEWYKGKTIYEAHPNEVLEMEAQLTIAAYQAKYPQEEFEILDVERTLKVQLPDYCDRCYSTEYVVNAQHPAVTEGLLCEKCRNYFLPGRHIFTGKIDLFVRSNIDGNLYIIDHKTEKRGAKSNLPQKWAEKDQASLYLWAAERIYGERPANFIVNVLTRQSDKGQVGPSFPERQKLERSAANIEHAVRDLVYWADKIEECQRIFGDKPWPANRENCYGWGPCEFALLHGYGEDTQLIREIKYQPKADYLHLDGVDIVK